MFTVIQNTMKTTVVQYLYKNKIMYRTKRIYTSSQLDFRCYTSMPVVFTSIIFKMLKRNQQFPNGFTFSVLSREFFYTA